jgi:hypothetical protein
MVWGAMAIMPSVDYSNYRSFGVAGNRRWAKRWWCGSAVVTALKLWADGGLSSRDGAGREENVGRLRG